jgi:NMT1/THI5 like
VGGSTDMVVGFYDHTVQMQVQNKEIRAVIMLNQLPAGAFVIRLDLPDTVKSLVDLKGMKIGIAALGSSSEFQTRYFMRKVGLKEGDFTLIPIGSDVTSIVAIERKPIEALNGTDPAVTIMQKRGIVDVMLGARTVEGTNTTYGGPYPNAVLYMNETFVQKYANTVHVPSMHWRGRCASSRKIPPIRSPALYRRNMRLETRTRSLRSSAIPSRYFQCPVISTPALLNGQRISSLRSIRKWAK